MEKKIETCKGKYSCREHDPDNPGEFLDFNDTADSNGKSLNSFHTLEQAS